MQNHTSHFSPRILVFDSGVGGLSILKEVQRTLPSASFVYLADNEAFPYGTKSEQALIARVDRVLHAALQRYPVDLIIVACNSASTIALPHIRNRFHQPIIGVVPAIKPAVGLSRSGVIGVLATPGTVSRRYTIDLINEFAPDADVVLHGSVELVELAESHLRGKPVARQLLIDILAPFRTAANAQLDTVVLACTHFPLLRQELVQAAPDHWQWVDSGEAIARRAAYLANETRLSSPQLPSLAAFTKVNECQQELMPALHHLGLHQLDELSVH